MKKGFFLVFNYIERDAMNILIALRVGLNSRSTTETNTIRYYEH